MKIEDIDSKIKNLIANYAYRNNLVFEKTGKKYFLKKDENADKEGIHVVSSSRKHKIIEREDYDKLNVLGSYDLNWKVDTHHTKLFKYISDNLTEEERSLLYKNHVPFVQFHTMVHSLAQKDKAESLHFFATARDYTHSSRIREPEVENLLLKKVAALCDTPEELKKLYLSYLTHHPEHYDETRIGGASRQFALRELVEDLIGVEHLQDFRSYLGAIKLNKQAQVLDEEIFLPTSEHVSLLRISRADLYQKIRLSSDSHADPENYNKLVDFMIDYFNSDLSHKKFGLKGCTSVPGLDIGDKNYDCFNIMIVQNAPAQVSDEKLKKIMFKSMEWISQNMEIIDNKNEEGFKYVERILLKEEIEKVLNEKPLPYTKKMKV